jgi:hypothetical protein
VKKFAASTAPPDFPIAFSGLHTTDDNLVNYTAHECGHAIARTAEEYLDGDGPTLGQTFRNQATEAQRIAGTVWWKSLAKASEQMVIAGLSLETRQRKRCIGLASLLTSGKLGQLHRA